MSVEAKPVAPVKLTIKDYKSDLHNDWCPGCVAPSTRIVTRSSSKPISDVAVGDLVLGHDGGYHKVTEVMSHHHPAPLRRLDVQGLGGVQWQYHGPQGPWQGAAVVRTPGTTTADLYLEPFQAETGRPFQFKLRFDEGGLIESAVGKAIHDEQRHRELGGEGFDGFFPAYRRPVATSAD